MAELGNLVSRLEIAVQKLEKIPLVTGSSGNECDDSPMWYDDFQTIYDDQWKKFLDDTEAQGDDLKKQGDLLRKAFTAHFNLLRVASSCNTPDTKDLPSLLKPLSDAISAVQDFREKNRGSKQINFLSALSEGVPFLGWIAVAPKPASYILQMEESAQFYTNKVLKEFRQSEPKKADWSNSWIKLLKGFQAYVKDNHGTGISWNKNKPKATTASLNSSASAPAAPPPPPSGAPAPPPPPPPPAASAPSSGNNDNVQAALFASLNKGADITQGLKKVTKDMQTHKNASLRQEGPVTSSAKNSSPRPYSPTPFKKFSQTATKKEPVFELQNKKWVIEHQDGNDNISIEGMPQQTIYMFNCKNSQLTIKNKCNNITLDSCKKCRIVFDDLISSCEFVNCQDVKAQVKGIVPTISIDKVDGINVFINKRTVAETQIVTAKSSEINITLMEEDETPVENGEFPLPEQYETKWNSKTGAFDTNVMSINL